MEKENGFVVQVGSIFYGPYADHDEAVKSHEGSDYFVWVLNEAPGTIRVKNCDRPWCSHCHDESKGEKS